MILQPNVIDYLTRIVIPLRLAVSSPHGPMVVSLWYQCRDGVLWCATRRDSYVVNCIEREPAVGFEVAADAPPYCGVRGRAIATVDAVRGEPVLRQLLDRYVGGADNSLGEKLLSRADVEVALRIEATWITTWNFSARMADAVAGERQHPCP